MRGIMNIEQKIELAVKSALDLKGFNIKSYDLRELSTYADFALLISAKSDRQTKSIADKIRWDFKENKEIPLGVEGEQLGEWILMDYNELIIHIFQEDKRFYYDLERFWENLPHKSYVND